MASISQLPTPDDLPDADVVIYDGNCKFCIQQVSRLRKWDGGNRLCFISLHDSFVAENYPDLSFEEMMEQMYVVSRSNGRKYGGARALRYLSRRLPRLWFAMPLLQIPFSLPVWQWIYRQVAKRRYRISAKQDDCDNDSCQIHG